MKSNKEFYRYTVDNNIYKWNANNGHFIKLTGWESGEDRRKYLSEIRQEFLETLNSDVARELVNKYWMSGIREWEHDGIRYNNDDTGLKSLWCEIPDHIFEKTYKDANGKKHTYAEKYKVVWHNGHIYFAQTFHYYPRIILKRLIDINEEPKLFAKQKWVHVRNLRPVKNLSTNKYI